MRPSSRCANGARRDALPGLSQRSGATVHDPVVYDDDPYAPAYGPGHGCAHCNLGAAAAGAALATFSALRRHGIPGTVRFFGSAGEEQLVGKAYAVKAGAYDGLDAFVDWHPGDDTGTGWGSNSAACSLACTFLGAGGHGGAPTATRSSLSAVTMLIGMAELLRERNVGPAGRLHYAIPAGGDAPNVVQDNATVWFTVRESSPARVRVLADKLIACAHAAATASATELALRFVTATWNRLGLRTGSELVHENMTLLGPPGYSATAHALAGEIQRTLALPQAGMARAIAPLRPPGALPAGSASDMGDVSRVVPVLSMRVATRAAGTPNHHWATTSLAGTEAGHAGLLAAARYMAATAIDLATQPAVLGEIRAEWRERSRRSPWRSLIPDGAEPPLYEPPAWFRASTGVGWPPAGVTWPRRRVVASLGPNATGPSA